MISEDQLLRWTRPASDSEEDRCDRATRMIRGAIEGYPGLAHRNVRVFAQGSYPNNTNARWNSDVDICVVFADVLFTSYLYATGESNASLGYTDSPHRYADDRATVCQALVETFNSLQVTVGNKAFMVHSNTARVNADVVAAHEFRGHEARGADGISHYVKGISFITRDGRQVINFPEQHAVAGRDKNLRTNNQYKYAVRALKQLRYSMLEREIAAADGVSSFLLECALSNLPDAMFMQGSWRERMGKMLFALYDAAENGTAENHWTEVSGKKWLLQPTYGIPANWQPKQLSDFAITAFRELTP